MGCYGGFRWMRDDSGLNWSWNGGKWIAGSWLRFWDGKWRGFGGLEGLVSGEEEEEIAAGFRGGRRSGMLGFSRSQVLSQVRQKVVEEC